MDEKIILTSIPIHTLKELINESVTNALQNAGINTNNKDELLTSDQVAEMLKISKVTLHNWKSQGRIRYHRMGRRVYFKLSEVMEGFMADGDL